MGTLRYRFGVKTMRDVLEYFALKRYGSIALLFVFTIFSLYYLLVFAPSIESNRRISFTCQNPLLSLTVSMPVYVANNSSLEIEVQNGSPVSLKNFKIIGEAQGKNTNFDSRLFVDDINIESLRGNEVVSRKSRISAFNVPKGTLVFMRFYEDYQGQITVCSGYANVPVTTYHEFYASVLSWVKDSSLMLSLIFFASVLSCSIVQDDRQDFHPLSRLGRLYIARVVARASVVLTVLFIGLQILTNAFLGIGLSLYYGNAYGILLIFLIFWTLLSSVLTRAIALKPKAKIVIKSQGEEKEVEIIGVHTKFRLKDFCKGIKICRSNTRSS